MLGSLEVIHCMLSDHRRVFSSIATKEDAEEVAARN